MTIILNNYSLFDAVALLATATFSTYISHLSILKQLLRVTRVIILLNLVNELQAAILYLHLIIFSFI
jgi:hypothetical protein